MKKAIIVFCMTVSALCFYSLANAMPFTVDARSPLHVFGSGVFSFPAALVLKKQQPLNGMSDTTIILAAGSLAMIPGITKEFLMDAYADGGDMAFNALGAYGGAWLGVKTGHYFFVSQKDETPVLNYVVRY